MKLTLSFTPRIMVRRIALFEERHPYIFSSVIALFIFGFALFYVPPQFFPDEDIADINDLEFIDMDIVQAPKRVSKKNISTDSGDIADSTEEPERASGESDEDAVDLSFYPNVSPPRLIGRIKKRYPKIARDLNVEALAIVELLIDETGLVKQVAVIGVRLRKELPPDLKKRVSAGFARDVRLMFTGARYSPPVINGKRKPIKMEEKIQFVLD